MMSMRLRTCCGIDGAVRQNCAAVSVVKKSTIADVADAATHVFERSCVDTPDLIGLYCVADFWIAAGCCIERDLRSARFFFLGMVALSTTGCGSRRTKRRSGGQVLPIPRKSGGVGRPL